MEKEDGFYKFVKNNFHWLIPTILIFIIVAPFIFTRSHFCEWLDFTQTGNIGDTIGGITAPIVGLISIILLYITLKEQISINKRQKKDNEFILLLNLQSQIQEKNNILTFRYNIGNARGEGKGIFEMSWLDGSLFENTSIANSMYNILMSNVQLIDVSIQQFLKLNFESVIDRDNKIAFYSFAEIYADQIISIYNMDIRNVVETLKVKNEIDDENLFGGEPNPLIVKKNKLSTLLQSYKCD